MSIESVLPSNHLILCCPLLLPPSNFPSIRVFSNESTLHFRWPNYWGFQLQHQSFQWIVRTYFLYNWLICQSFTIDSLAYEITQPRKTNHTAFPHHSCPLWWPTHCGVCFTLYLPKSIPYLSLCFSLNYFCGETSRTQASLGPETRYCGFRLGLSPAMWIWVPNWLLAGFQSQSEVNSFKSIID